MKFNNFNHAVEKQKKKIEQTKKIEKGKNLINPNKLKSKFKFKSNIYVFYFFCTFGKFDFEVLNALPAAFNHAVEKSSCLSK